MNWYTMLSRRTDPRIKGVNEEQFDWQSNSLQRLLKTFWHSSQSSFCKDAVEWALILIATQLHLITLMNILTFILVVCLFVCLCRIIHTCMYCLLPKINKHNSDHIRVCVISMHVQWTLQSWKYKHTSLQFSKNILN